MEWLPFVTVNNVNSNCHLAARLEIFLYKITGFRYNKKKEYNKTNEENGGKEMMKAKKCILAGVLAFGMLCQGAFAPGFVWPGNGVSKVLAAAENVARNKTVTASGVESGADNCTPDKAVDGEASENSRWSAPKMRNSQSDAVHTPQWLMIDLGANETVVESIKIVYHLKVWSTQYRIQTSDTGAENSWTDVYTVSGRASSDDNAVTDDIQAAEMTNASLKRYVRFYFEKVNDRAGGNSVSVREIEIYGTQTGAVSTAGNAQEALNIAVVPTVVEPADTSFEISRAPEGYEVKVYGSEVDRVIGDDGTLSPLRIGDRTMNVIVQATNKSNAGDTAKKNVSVTVKDNTSQFPELFPTVARPNEKPKVLPTIQEWYGYEGDVVISENTEIVYHDAANLGLAQVAQEMQEDLTEICGFTPKVKAGTEHDSDDIYLESLTDDVYGTGKEGYLLKADDNGIHIASADRTGVLYGTVTVEQILYQDAKHQSVPKGVIRDYPLYAVRGINFDVARIPTRMPFMEDYTKILKWYKLNEMQVHLNDCQWSTPRNSANYADWEITEASHRLWSDFFPSLATQNSKFEREGDNPGRYDYYYSTHTGTGGELYYTKEEFKNLEKMAEARGVQVVAELDTPGHSAPYTKYVYANQKEVITSLTEHGYLNRDEYLDASGNVKKNFYIHHPRNFELLAIDDQSTDEATRQNAIHAKIFMTALFDEYLGGDDPVFTAASVSAGVDEYWDNTAANQSAFRRYMNFMYDLIGEKYGKEVRMWGGLKLMGGSSGVNRDIILDEWNVGTEDDPKARMNEGFRVINVPQPYLYTTPGRYHKDMPNEEYLFYNWDPTVFSNSIRADKGEPLLLGAKAALWGDSNRSGTTEADLHERYLRLCAMVGEKTWGGQKAEDTFLAYEQTFDNLREGPGTEVENDVDSMTNVVLDYDFENVSKDETTIYDASGNGYHGTITNGSVEVKSGEYMLKFDGSTTITTPLQSLGYPYTMSFDVYLDGTESNTKESSLFSGYDGRLQIAGMNGSLSLNRSCYSQSFDYTVGSGGLHKITIVGTYETTKLYVDGEFQKILYPAARDTDNGGNRDNQNWTDADNNYQTTFVFPLNIIGKDFSGYLGNIKAYKKALTAEEMAADASGVAEADVARNQNAYADNANSTYSSDLLKLYPAWKATDGDGHVTGATGVSVNNTSRWNSSNNANDFLMVDLGQARTIQKVVIDWEANRYAASYKIQVSDDGKTWTDVKSVTGNVNALTTDTFDAVTARYVKMQGVQCKSGASEYGIFEIRVYGPVDKDGLKDVCERTRRKLTAYKISWENADAQYESYVFAKAVLGDVLAGQEEVEAAIGALAAGEKKAEVLAGEAEILSNQSLYEAASWSVYQKAYDAVRNAPANISIQELDARIDALKAAKQALVKIKIDKPVVPEKKAVPLAAPAVSAVKSTATKVKVTWKASANAASYQLYRKVGSKAVKVGAPVTGTTAYDTAPVGGKNVSYYVIAMTGNPELYTDSPAGSAKSVKLPKATAKATAVQEKGKKAVLVKWKKVKGAASYMIYRAEGKNGKWKKAATVKKAVSWRDKKVKKGKTYSYKIVTVSAKKYSPMKAAKKAVKIK